MFSFLFQIIFKVLCNPFVEMNTLVSSHIVWFTRIDEEIGLSALLDTLSDERQAVLRHHRFVVSALNNL